MPWLCTLISSCEVLFELLGQGNWTHQMTRTTHRTTRLISSFEVVAGVFCLTGK